MQSLASYASCFIASIALSAQTPLAPNAPADKVYPLTANIQEVMKSLTLEAKKSWPSIKIRFSKGLPKGHVLFVTIMLTDSANHQETAFLEVHKIEDGSIFGVLSTEFESLVGYKIGQKVQVKETDILDWTISNPDGSEEGNLVGKFLEKNGQPK